MYTVVTTVLLCKHLVSSTAYFSELYVRLCMVLVKHDISWALGSMRLNV